MEIIHIRAETIYFPDIPSCGRKLIWMKCFDKLELFPWMVLFLRKLHRVKFHSGWIYQDIIYSQLEDWLWFLGRPATWRLVCLEICCKTKVETLESEYLDNMKISLQYSEWHTSNQVSWGLRSIIQISQQIHWVTGSSGRSINNTWTACEKAQCNNHWNVER